MDSDMNVVMMRLTGLSPLMMHSAAGADPMNPLAREMKSMTSKRGKTEDIYEKMSELEHRLGLYWDKNLGVFVPTINIRAAIIEGAKKSKQGKTVMCSTGVVSSKAKLEYEGPTTPEDLWKTAEFRDIRSVVVGQARVMRTRPVFPEWQLQFGLWFDPEQIQRDNLLEYAAKAGKMIGIGDYRPTCNGDFGRFTVAEVKA